MNGLRPDYFGERGSATVHAVALVGLLIWVAVVVAAGAGLVVAHRQAAAAADLAALAGASAIQHGRPGCGVAGQVAAANQARLVECIARGEVLTLVVAVDVQHELGGWAMKGRARAGPVS